MPQYWQGHWTDDAFAPKRLRNWEVSKWYPSLPIRHCVITKFITDDNGHILDDVKKDKHSPWGTYKGTWELPKKITRSMAKELSVTPEYKKDSWNMYMKKHQNLCKKIEQIKKKEEEPILESSKDTSKKDQTDKPSCIFIEKDEED